MCAQDSVGNKTISDAMLKSPLSIRSGKSGVSSMLLGGSVKNANAAGAAAMVMSTPASIHSYKSNASNYSGGRRPSRKDFSSAGQQLLQKLMRKK